MSASARFTVSMISSTTSRTLVRSSILVLSRPLKMCTSPLLWGSFGAAAMTLWRTVAICGLCRGQTIVAMMFPPKAGLVCMRSPVSGSISRAVQSAVRPVFTREATMGMKERPMKVAPASTMDGLRSSMRSLRTEA